MAKINRLTNRSREKLRAPFLPEPVNNAVLSAIFPRILKKPAKSIPSTRQQSKSNSVKQKPSENRAFGNGAAAKQTPHLSQTRNSAQPPQKNGSESASYPTSSAKPSQPAQPDNSGSSQTGSGPKESGAHDSGPKDNATQNSGPQAGRSTRPPGLFLPSNRIVQPGSTNSHSRHANTPSNPPTRPIQQNPANKTNGRYDNSPARNGFSHHPGVLRSKPASLLPDSVDKVDAKPVPHLTHQEPPTQLPLDELPGQVSILPVKNPVIPSTPREQPDRSLQGLREVLEQQPDLPSQTSLLGVCDDGLPVLLDLNDPKPGALLIMGDEREPQLNLLRSAIASLAMRNSPRSVQILIISYEAQVWRDWIAKQGFQRFCIGIEGVDDLDVLSDWLIRLADWTEQRRTGEISGPPVLVVLDTLSFMPRLAYDIRLNFEWMAKEGPAAQIWPLATISTELANLLNNRRMLRSFRTRVLGFSENISFYTQVGGLKTEEVSQFSEPGVFAVPLGDDWLRFRLPEPKNR